jgi:hypothetical protein
MALVKLNNRGVRSATTFGSITGLGSMVFIKKQTASSSATISFVDGTSDVVLDDTYKEYLFTFNNMHPATSGVDFQFNLSIDGGSNYNATKTSTGIRTFHGEDGSSAALAYYDGTNANTYDLAQSTSFQTLFSGVNNNNDDSGSGTIKIFNPSSTTFVKHYMTDAQFSHSTPRSMRFIFAGYANTTSAVDAIQFKMSSGNIDAGDICLYGIN